LLKGISEGGYRLVVVIDELGFGIERPLLLPRPKIGDVAAIHVG